MLYRFAIPVTAWVRVDPARHGFLSFPYVESEGFESFDCESGRTTVAWLIPVTSSEREFKKKNGVEALETLFEKNSLEYLNPSRASLV